MLKKGTLASPATALASRVLPVPGGADQKHSLGDPPPSVWNFSGSLQELDDFLELLLCLIDARHIGEGDLRLVLCEKLGFALGERHTPIPGPIFFIANRQIRSICAMGRTHERIPLRNLLS